MGLFASMSNGINLGTYNEINPATMKNLLLLLMLGLSLQYTCGQTKTVLESDKFFRFGFKAGVNINKVEGKSYKEGFNFNYLLGIFSQFNISKRFGIQPELNLAQGTAEFTDDGTSIYDDLFLDGTQKQSKLTHIEVPVLLNINIGQSNRVKLQLGPQYGNLIKQVTDSLRSGNDIFSKAEWSAIGGVWIQLPLVNIGARYRLGLTDVNAVDNRQSWKSKGFNLFVGVTL